MSRRATLRSSRDFRKVYRSGRRVRRNGVTVWALPRDPAWPTRLGMSVRSAKIGAVARNKVRRRLRAIVDAYGASPGFDVVVAADSGATGKTFQELQQEVSGALEGAGVPRR